MIIILFPYKFTNFFFKKYQIARLKSKFKGKVEVHDISEIISKNRKDIFKRKNDKNIIVFKKIKDWEKHLVKIIKSEKKLALVNLTSYSLDSFKSFYIHYLLSKFKINIIEMNSAEVYEYTANKSINAKFKTFFKYLFLNQSRLILILKNIFFIKLVSFLKFNKIYATTCGSTAKNFLLPKMKKAKEIEFVDFHASDFENYLANKKKFIKKKKQNFIVFLDARTPAFIGDKFYLKYKINYDKKKWYKDVNSFLSNIEKVFKSKVIIVPHPAVRNFKNIYYDKKFIVSKDLDASNKLISNCRFVLSISATTAVSYCVIYNKPITFIHNHQMIKHNPIMFSEMKIMSKILSAKNININKNFDKKNICMKVNKKRYLKYKYDFMTSKKIKNQTNTEILYKLTR